MLFLKRIFELCSCHSFFFHHTAHEHLHCCLTLDHLCLYGIVTCGCQIAFAVSGKMGGPKVFWIVGTKFLI